MTDSPASRTVLDVRDVSLRFGGVRALHEVDMDVETRSICGLVGPNGAGKTSLFNCISGYYRPSAGSIRISGRDVLVISPHELAGLGVARTFQHPILQVSESVLTNVLVGGHLQLHEGVLAHLFALPSTGRAERRLRTRALELLDYLSLGAVTGSPAGDLPYGSQKRVEIARALLSDPHLLLLDEPASGLPHQEVGELGAVIARLRDDLSLTILIVEHHMGLISAITDKVVVLVEGEKIAEGTAAHVQSNPAVISAYLGGAA